MLTFIVPGSIRQLTGGYLFDRQLVETLRDQGRPVEVIELEGQFPCVDELAQNSARAALCALADGALVVMDGLALPAFAQTLPEHATRLRLIAFVHHPLSLEAGIDPALSRHLAAVEAQIWPMMRGVICPSAHSAQYVVASGVDVSRVAIAPPGTARVVQPSGMTNYPHQVQSEVKLLTVGTVIPRKGHDLLLDALADLPEQFNWSLDCVGSLERDAALAAQLRQKIAAQGWENRVVLHGELEPFALKSKYADADVFVLASWHEGYGMAYAEAMAWGLPMIATQTGAIPEVVPRDAALWVQPGDRQALTHALAQLIGQPSLRATMAQACITHAQQLPDWAYATSHWMAQVDRLAGDFQGASD